jgi:hypothetical protein
LEWIVAAVLMMKMGGGGGGGGGGFAVCVFDRIVEIDRTFLAIPIVP